jgi:hypothetical protein
VSTGLSSWPRHVQGPGQAASCHDSCAGRLRTNARDPVHRHLLDHLFDRFLRHASRRSPRRLAMGRPQPGQAPVDTGNRRRKGPVTSCHLWATTPSLQAATETVCLSFIGPGRVSVRRRSTASSPTSGPTSHPAASPGRRAARADPGCGPLTRVPVEPVPAVHWRPCITTDANNRHTVCVPGLCQQAVCRLTHPCWRPFITMDVSNGLHTCTAGVSRRCACRHPH